ncbi:hypothetical protein E1301_Tti008091 [Triplophysa tibetana]|uniref:Uncharacterized protein n=1 Tax=Triplophysa tibetana TaxID=1572043 RepID=A0A5A9NHH5_9TELE|nr:hypothetical protein E1301_Tti008091 [Triplophysa tibetana]
MPLETFSVDAPAAHTSVKNGGFWKMSGMKVSIADKAMQFKQTFDRLQKSPTSSLRVAPQRSVPMILYCLAALGISHSSHSTRADLFVYVCVADAASARLPPPLTDCFAQLHVKREGVAEAVKTQNSPSLPNVSVSESTHTFNLVIRHKPYGGQNLKS